MVIKSEEPMDSEEKNNVGGDSTENEIIVESTSSLNDKHLSFLKSLNLLDSCGQQQGQQQLESILTAQNWQSWVTTLLAKYGARLSPDDLICLEILRFLERRCNAFVSLDKLQPLVWGDYGNRCYDNLKKYGFHLWRRPSIDDLLRNNINADVMLKTSLKLPLEINLNYQATDETYHDLYDPRFLLPLFNGVFKQECLVDCKLFIKTNCLHLVLACLSLRDNTLRKCAYSVLFKFRSYLTSSTVKFDEKSIILHTLTTLRNSLDKPNAKLPSILTIFLGKAFRILLQPGHRMFQAINSFLLLKPTLDLDDVPEFYKFFHSTATTVDEKTNTSDFLYERHWMLELLSQGLRQRQDYLIFRRRFVTKLLLSFFLTDSSLCCGDTKTRRLILEILKSACRLKSVALELCFESNILAWILFNLNDCCSGCQNEEKRFLSKYGVENGEENSTTIILAELADVLLILRATMRNLKNKNAWKTVKFTWISCACVFFKQVTSSKSSSISNSATKILCDQVKSVLNEELNELSSSSNSSEKQMIKRLLKIDEKF